MTTAIAIAAVDICLRQIVQHISLLFLSSINAVLRVANCFAMYVMYFVYVLCAADIPRAMILVSVIVIQHGIEHELRMLYSYSCDIYLLPMLMRMCV